MIFLYIYVGVSVLAFTLHWSISVEATHMFKQRYPDMRTPKSYLSGWITALIKSFTVCVLPIFNVFYLLTLVTKGDEIIESSIRKVYAKCTSNRSFEETSDSGDE